MTTNQGKWPIVVAGGLLCLMTLLSFISWSGQNPLKDQAEESLPQDPADRKEYLAEIDARFNEPVIPEFPAKARPPILNRYKPDPSIAKNNDRQEVDNNPDHSVGPKQVTASKPSLPTLPLGDPPRNESPKPADDTSNPRMIAANTEDPVLPTLPASNRKPNAERFENKMLKDVFGDNIQDDFQSVQSAPTIRKAPGDVLPNPLPGGDSVDLAKQDIEQSLLGQFAPGTSAESKSKKSESLPLDLLNDSGSKSVSNANESPIEPLFPEMKLPASEKASPSLTRPPTNENRPTDPDDQIIALLNDPEKSKLHSPQNRVPGIVERNPTIAQTNRDRKPTIQAEDRIAETPPGSNLIAENSEEPNLNSEIEAQPRIVENSDTNPGTKITKNASHPKPVAKKAAWPMPTVLMERLDSIQQFEIAADWALQTRQLVSQLQQSPDFADPGVARSLGHLYRQVAELDRILETMRSERDAFQQSGSLQRLRYQLHRRLEIWTAVYRLAANGEESKQDGNGDFKLASSQKLNFEEVPAAWREYLKLDQLKQVFDDQSSSANSRKRAARQVLARATANHLTDAQFEYIEELLGPSLAQMLRDEATRPTDITELLQHIELFEQSSNGITHYYLNNHYQNLYWSADTNANYLAELIDVHYRNANLRFSLSDKLINRLLPSPNELSPANPERGLGAPILNPEINNKQFAVSLVPHESQWQIRLHSKGEVVSRSRLQREGSALQSFVDADYQASKDLRFTLDGSFPAETVVQARQKRSAAHLVESKIRAATKERFDEQVNGMLNQVLANINQSWTHPLGSKDLEPEAIEMKTTSERLIMRYRLAGQDQMASNTARPMAVKNSVGSAQVHESAINNFISRTGIGGRRFTLPEFSRYLNSELGYSLVNFDESARENDVEFTLAKIDPVRMDFDDHFLSVTIRLRTLRIGSSVWKNVAVTCPFNLSARGLQLRLSKRDPGISLTGSRLRLRDQIAIRSVFHKLIENDFEFSLDQIPMLAKLKIRGLWISQLVFSEGWAGISINDESTLPSRQTGDAAQQETHHLSREPRQHSILRIR